MAQLRLGKKPEWDSRALAYKPLFPLRTDEEVEKARKEAERRPEAAAAAAAGGAAAAAAEPDAASVEWHDGTRRLRLAAERRLLEPKPLALVLLVLRRLYRTGGPGLLLKLFALPTPDAPWLPLGPEQRKAFQSSKKRAVVDPFSLLIEPVPPSSRKKAQLDPVAAAAKEYERMADLALRVDRLKIANAKDEQPRRELQRLDEEFERLGANDRHKARDNALVGGLVAATFHLRLREREREQRERLKGTWRRPPKDEKHDLQLLHSAQDCVARLLGRRFGSGPLQQVLLYVLRGCEGHPLHASVPEQVAVTNLADLFDGPTEAERLERQAQAAAAAVAAEAAAEAEAAAAQFGYLGRQGRRARAAHHGGSRGAELRRGPGEGFVAALKLQARSRRDLAADSSSCHLNLARDLAWRRSSSRRASRRTTRAPSGRCSSARLHCSAAATCRRWRATSSP